MTYVPNRIVTRKTEIDEELKLEEEFKIDGRLIQRNLDLISKEMKELRDMIVANANTSEKSVKPLRNKTQFVNAFLFG